MRIHSIMARNRATQEPSARPRSSTPPLPEAFRCPIGLDMMDDPVIAADGFNYQRGAIETHLRGTRKPARSPMTGAVLPHPHLASNHELRGRISDFCGRTLAARPSSPRPLPRAAAASPARYVNISHQSDGIERQRMREIQATASGALFVLISEALIVVVMAVVCGIIWATERSSRSFGTL